MNLFLKELKFNRKALIIWSVSMVLLVYVCIAKFETIASMGSAVSDVFNSLPKIAKAIFGIADYDIMTIGGYFCMTYYYVVIVLAIHAIMLGSGILSKEQKDRTSEFLMAKPISRNKVITMKLLACIVNILVVNVLTTVAFLGLMSKYTDLTNSIISTMGVTLLLQFLFLCIGLVISVIRKKEKGAGGTAALVVFVMFFIGLFMDMADNLDFLRVLTPFRYFQAQDLVFGTGFEWMYFAISAALIVGSLIITYVEYNKRDLTV